MAETRERGGRAVATYTLDELRPGLSAILDRLGSCDWAEIDSMLYGSVQSHSRDCRCLNDMRRIKDAFPQAIWDALEREKRADQAAQLRAQADALEAEDAR